MIVSVRALCSALKATALVVPAHHVLALFVADRTPSVFVVLMLAGYTAVVTVSLIPRMGAGDVAITAYTVFPCVVAHHTALVAIAVLIVFVLTLLKADIAFAFPVPEMVAFFVANAAGAVFLVVCPTVLALFTAGIAPTPFTVGLVFAGCLTIDAYTVIPAVTARCAAYGAFSILPRVFAGLVAVDTAAVAEFVGTRHTAHTADFIFVKPFVTTVRRAGFANAVVPCVVTFHTAYDTPAVLVILVFAGLAASVAEALVVIPSVRTSRTALNADAVIPCMGTHHVADIAPAVPVKFVYTGLTATPAGTVLELMSACLLVVEVCLTSADLADLIGISILITGQLLSKYLLSKDTEEVLFDSVISHAAGVSDGTDTPLFGIVPIGVGDLVPNQ